MSITRTISIVIPMYNEEHRLPETMNSLRAFAAVHEELTEIVMVDDGSSDLTPQTARQTGAGLPIRLISYSENAGKGYAIRRGVLETTGDVVLLSDADLSTPLDELDRLIPHLVHNDVVIGSRALDPSTVRVRQAWYRQSMGKSFNRLMRLIVRLPFHDTQCGFKLFRGPVARDIFREAVVDRFAYDVEALVLALQRGYSVEEVPVLWFDRQGSSVSVGRDSLRMLLDLFLIRIRLGSPSKPPRAATGDDREHRKQE